MKNNIYKKVITLLFSFILVIISCGYSTAFNNSYAENKNNIYIKNFDMALKQIADTDISSEYLQFESALATFSDEEVLSIIDDPTLSMLTKKTTIQQLEKINNGKGVENSKLLVDLLEKGKLEDELRISLINSISADNVDIKKSLARIVTTEEGPVVLRALMRIKESDAKFALEISNEILSQVSKQNPDRIRAAVTIKSSYFRELKLANSIKYVNEEEKEFIEASLDIYESSDNLILKDSIIFALMNMMNFDAVKFIVMNESVDEELKYACISRNLYTFIDIINDEPSVEDINFIILAMNKVPLKELSQHLHNMLEKYPEYRSNELINVISLMESVGVDADVSRFERTYSTNWLN